MDRKEEFNLGLEKNAEQFLQNFIKDLTERLAKMEEVLVVDKIEGNLAVCENRKNRKMKNLPLSTLPKGTTEGSILKWENGKYKIDESGQIENRIRQKMKDVWED